MANVDKNTGFFSKGNDLKITINLTLEEIFKGTSKTIKIKIGSMVKTD